MNRTVLPLALATITGLGAGVALSGSEDSAEPTRAAPMEAAAPAAVAAPPNVAFVANAHTMADALAGGSAAARLDAPVVTTRQDILSSDARAVLEDLDPVLVVVLGGEAAIADDVIDQISTATGLTEVPLTPVPETGIVRVGGENRIETAAMLARLSRHYDSPFAAAEDARLPLAYGRISEGDVLSANTPNVESAVWEASLNRWRISFTDIHFFSADFVTQATVTGGTGVSGEVRATSVGGDLLLATYDSQGNSTKLGVNFTVYQP